MNIKTIVDAERDYIIERRRYYHQHPELSGEEKETAAAIRADLESMGIAVDPCKTCYGLTALIKGQQPGKTIALRADIDALAICEETGLPFASQNGKMHACGHDAHIAMLLGAAKILQQSKDQMQGNAKLIIQPSEENACGAPAMVAEGVLDGVDAIYGAHVWGGLDAPLIDVTGGERMAGFDKFTITVKGASAHGGTPHLGIDAVVAASALVMNLQILVSRINDPLNPLVISIGTINGGSANNIIANKVEMEGIIRYFHHGETIRPRMERVIQNTCEAYAAGYEFDYQKMNVPLINSDSQLVRIAHDSVVELYGEQSIGHLAPMMASEDYSHYIEKVPGLFCFIGSRNVQKGLTANNHQERYTVDEDVLTRGASVMAQFALNYLAE